MTQWIGCAAALAAVTLVGCGGSDDAIGDLFAPRSGSDAGAKLDGPRARDATSDRGAAPDRGANPGTDARPGSDASPDPQPLDAQLLDATREALADDATIERTTDPPDPGGPLDRQRWEVPCGRVLPYDDRLCSNLPADVSVCPNDYRPVDNSLTFGGPPGAHFSVTLRLRGVLELKSYTGGAAAGGHFQIGGTPANGVVNAYGFSVSSPYQVYYINAARSGSGSVVTIDDTVTVPIDGGATVNLFAADTDCVQLRNCVDPSASVCSPYVVAGIPPAPNAFIGQFAQVDVVSVAAGP